LKHIKHIFCSNPNENEQLNSIKHGTQRKAQLQTSTDQTQSILHTSANPVLDSYCPYITFVSCLSVFTVNACWIRCSNSYHILLSFFMYKVKYHSKTIYKQRVVLHLAFSDTVQCLRKLESSN